MLNTSLFIRRLSSIIVLQYSSFEAAFTLSLSPSAYPLIMAIGVLSSCETFATKPLRITSSCRSSSMSERSFSLVALRSVRAVLSDEDSSFTEFASSPISSLRFILSFCPKSSLAIFLVILFISDIGLETCLENTSTHIIESTRQTPETIAINSFATAAELEISCFCIRTSAVYPLSSSFVHKRNSALSNLLTAVWNTIPLDRSWLFTGCISSCVITNLSFLSEK